MDLNSFYYWKFNETLSDHDIDYILDIAKDRWSTGKIFKGENKDVRKSDIVWTDDQKIYDLIWPFMESANKAFTNFDIDYAEVLQITRYRENEFYDYHIDGTGVQYYDAPDSDIYHKKTRKLSMSLVLNDDFEGGDLQFYDDEPVQCKKGNMIFFPSYLLHRVLPVTKGVRYSLVTWFLGPPLR